METVSFICVVFNHPVDMVQRMINSIDNVMQYCPRYEYDIILVDHSDEKGSYNSFNSCTIIDSNNTGYCGGNNTGIGQSSSNYIIIINPDIILEKSLCVDWMVGSAKLYNAISGKVVGTNEWYTYTSSFPTSKKYKPEELPFFFNEPTLKKSGNWKPFRYVDGCLMCFSKSLWEKVGGFDESIFPGYFGENAFAFNAFLKGYRIINAHIDGFYSHKHGKRPFKEEQDVIKWSKDGRQYFYQHYALTNWDKFLEYLNI
jgi:GT2 family glycosyltransferase